MNEVEAKVRTRFEAYQAWLAKAGTPGNMFTKDTPEAFRAFCSGWNAGQASMDAGSES